MPSFDLQAHSVHSDGTLPAGEVVERAAAAGSEPSECTECACRSKEGRSGIRAAYGLTARQDREGS